MALVEAVDVSANGEVYFSDIIAPTSYTIADLVKGAHKALAEDQKWEYAALVPGQFGYDVMAVSISRAIDTALQKDTISLNKVAGI
jgi:hypothetical protein